jgi:hypothetical protein
MEEDTTGAVWAGVCPTCSLALRPLFRVVCCGTREQDRHCTLLPPAVTRAIALFTRRHPLAIKGVTALGVLATIGLTVAAALVDSFEFTYGGAFGEFMGERARVRFTMLSAGTSLGGADYVAPGADPKDSRGIWYLVVVWIFLCFATQVRCFVRVFFCFFL